MPVTSLQRHPSHPCPPIHHATMPFISALVCPASHHHILPSHAPLFQPSHPAVLASLLPHAQPGSQSHHCTSVATPPLGHPAFLSSQPVSALEAWLPMPSLSLLSHLLLPTLVRLPHLAFPSLKIVLQLMWVTFAVGTRWLALGVGVGLREGREGRGRPSAMREGERDETGTERD